MSTKNTKRTETATADELAAVLARNSKPQPEQPKPAETDHAEREAAKPEARPTVPEAPTAPTKAPKAEAEGRICACGCDGTTRGGRFLPGHDARLHGRIKRALEGRLDTTGLSSSEQSAVQDAIAEGHVPGGSFAPQDHKAPAHGEAKLAEKKRAALHAKIARLQAEMDAAKAELAGLGEEADEPVATTEHEEIVQAMAAEGTLG